MSVRTARRLGVMGGTFDPIHHGHLVAASEVADVFGLDEVIFVPTGEPVFKQERRVTSAEHRYLMTVVATASNPRFNVSRVDIDRPGLTYTIDTLRDLKSAYPDAELFFITGADVLPEILQWKDVDELWSLAHFIGVNRPGHRLDDTGLPSNGVSLLEVPAMAISSTDCRQRVKRGMPVWYLVPDGVVQYIGKHNLYRGDDVRVLSDDDRGSGGETDGAARDADDDGAYGDERTPDGAAEPGPDDGSRGGTGTHGGPQEAGVSEGTSKSAAGEE